MNNTDYSRIVTYLTQNCLVIPIQTDLYDDFVRELNRIILQRLENAEIIGVIIDLSALEIIDATNFQQLISLTKMVALMGRQTVFTGFRPAVVAALVNLNIAIKDITVFINLETCFNYFQTISQKMSTVKTAENLEQTEPAADKSNPENTPAEKNSLEATS